jgi:hypothetical protein
MYPPTRKREGVVTTISSNTIVILRNTLVIHGNGDRVANRVRVQVNDHDEDAQKDVGVPRLLCQKSS